MTIEQTRTSPRCFLDSRNPATGEVLGTFPVCTTDDVRAAVASARQAQRSWGALTARKRARALRALRGVLVRQMDELVRLEVTEQGKTQVEAHGVLLALNHLVSFFCGVAPRVLKPRRKLPFMGLHRAHRVIYEPHGVVGVISPWNYPLTLSLEPILAAVIAGNAVVLKPSEHTPLVGLKVAELLREAGLPEHLVQVVTGDGDTGAALVESGIDKLVLTGSIDTGRKVAALAAGRVLPVTLELGGKDAAIVLDDADLERAAAGIVWGGSLNAGQACLAIERVYVIETVADQFTEALVAKVNRLRVGPGSDAETEIGAITTEAQLQSIERHVEDAIAKGAKVLCGGGRLDGPGWFYRPTVLSETTDDMLVVREETFGPVIVVERVRDAAEAVERTNRCRFGLTCSVWTRKLGRGRDLAHRIEAGDVAINEHGAPAGHAEIPWGGVKMSGYGRTRGVEGLLDMVTTKHVSWPRFQTRRELYWFPYSGRTVNSLRKAMYLLYGSWRDRIAVFFGKR